MKKQIYFLATAALATGLAACSNDELEGDYSQNLASDHLVASVEQAVSTRVNVEGKSLTWVKGDAIGVFSDDGDENQKYSILTDEAAAISDFSNDEYTDAEKNNKKAPVTNPKFAYYPYSAQSGDVNRKEEVTITVPAAVDYDPKNDVLMPMIGNITGSHVAFQNTAAILRVNVVGMPANTASVSLTSNVTGMNLSGEAKLNFKNASLTMGTEAGESNANQIVTINAKTLDQTTGRPSLISSTSTFQGDNVTFYFVVPVGNYSNAGGKTYVSTETGKDKGLIFQIGTDGATFTADLNAQKNHLYEATLYYDSSTSAFVKDDIITTLNDDLGNIEDGGEATADWTVKDAVFAAGTIYVPSVPAGQTPLDKVTINLKGVGSSDNTLTITAAPGGTVTPKEVVINVNTVKETAADANTKTSDPTYGALTITLPNSAVTLNKLGDKDVTLTTVTSSTAANVFKIKKGITISSLTVSAGNVYLEEGAKVITTSNNCYIFDAGRKESEGVATTAPYYAPLSIYDLLFPTGTKTIQLPDKGFDVTLQSIEITAGKDITIDLHGQPLTTKVAKNIIKVTGEDAKLTIIDTAKEAGSIAAGDADAATSAVIAVTDGGQVTVNKGAISSSKGDAVTVENGTFTLDGGTISAATEGKVALSLKNGATATLNSEDVIGGTGDNKNYTVKGAITIAKAGTTAAVTDKASTLELKKGNVGGTITATESTFTLTDGTITATTQITAGKGATININGSSVKTVTEDSQADATTAINVNGGKVTDGIALEKGTVLTVKGGEIGGTTITNAVSITKGTLNVTGTGEPVITGQTVIKADGKNDDDAVITLDAAKAKYVSTKTWVIYNSKITGDTSAAAEADNYTAAKAAKMLITAGKFTGDVASDAASYFIKGGYFKNCGNLSQYGTSNRWFYSGYGLNSTPDSEDYLQVVAGSK